MLAGGDSGGSGADIEALAQAVIRGEYGNGDAHRTALGSNYEAVQTRVNQLLGSGGSSGGVERGGHRLSCMCGDPRRLWQRGGAQAPPRRELRRGSGARERAAFVGSGVVHGFSTLSTRQRALP